MRCCSIPTSATPSCGFDLLSTVPETQLREDQSDLANWTRGDRKARFEQTAERHAGLSQFAAPFLARMKFVDEQGEGTSPTLSALRVYREHRAAGRRSVPPYQDVVGARDLPDRIRRRSPSCSTGADGAGQPSAAAVSPSLFPLLVILWGDGTTSASDGQQLRHAAQGAAATEPGPAVLGCVWPSSSTPCPVVFDLPSCRFRLDEQTRRRHVREVCHLTAAQAQIPAGLLIAAVRVADAVD